MTIDEFKKNIAPYMRKGYVSMDKDETWWWYMNKPRNLKVCWDAETKTENDICFLAKLFKIEPVEGWTKSLIEVGK